MTDQSTTERIAELERKNAELVKALQEVRPALMDAYFRVGDWAPKLNAAIAKIDLLLARASGAMSIAEKHERCRGLVPPCKPDCICQFEADRSRQPAANASIHYCHKDVGVCGNGGYCSECQHRQPAAAASHQKEDKA